MKKAVKNALEAVGTTREHYTKNSIVGNQVEQELRKKFPKTKLMNQKNGKLRTFELNIGKGLNINQVESIFYNTTNFTPLQNTISGNGKNITNQSKDYAIMLFFN